VGSDINYNMTVSPQLYSTIGKMSYSFQQSQIQDLMK